MFSTITLAPKTVEAVARQIRNLQKKSPDGVKIIPNDDDIFDIEADISGPSQTPYEGGVFRIKLELPQEFPKIPPKGYFLTKIFHPNISEKGEICVNTLKKDWSPQTWSLSHILEVIKCLLIIPFPESALNDDAGKLFMEDYEEYRSRAKLFTQIYALPQGTPASFSDNKFGNNNRNLQQTKDQDQNFDPKESGFDARKKNRPGSGDDDSKSKENINEIFGVEILPYGGPSGLGLKFGQSGVLGDKCGNLMGGPKLGKPEKPGKKDDKKKWLKRI
jgi:ubiquitin-conjugating enzyme E2 S